MEFYVGDWVQGRAWRCSYEIGAVDLDGDCYIKVPSGGLVRYHLDQQRGWVVTTPSPLRKKQKSGFGKWVASHG